MRPRLTTITVTLIAAIMLTAASTATAATFKLSGEGTVKLTQEGNQRLAFEGGSMFTCEKSLAAFTWDRPC
jgi:hypothetical protein